MIYASIRSTQPWFGFCLLLRCQVKHPGDSRSPPYTQAAMSGPGVRLCDVVGRQKFPQVAEITAEQHQAQPYSFWVPAIKPELGHTSQTTSVLPSDDFLAVTCFGQGLILT